MSPKKRAKKLRKHLAAQFADWLDERTPEELELVRVRVGITKAAFRAFVEGKPAGNDGSEGR